MVGILVHVESKSVTSFYRKTLHETFVTNNATYALSFGVHWNNDTSILKKRNSQKIGSKCGQTQLDQIDSSNCLRTEKVVLNSFLLDYSKSNVVAKRDFHPVPYMMEYIDSLGKGTKFSTLHTNEVYLRIKSDEAGVNPIALTALYRSYHIIRMPFELHNTPINNLTHRLGDTIYCIVVVYLCRVYVENIVECSESSKEQIEKVLSANSLRQRQIISEVE